MNIYYINSNTVIIHSTKSNIMKMKKFAKSKLGQKSTKQVVGGTRVETGNTKNLKAKFE